MTAIPALAPSIDRPIPLSQLQQHGMTVMVRCQELAERITTRCRAELQQLTQSTAQTVAAHYRKTALQLPIPFDPIYNFPTHVSLEGRSYLLCDCPEDPEMAGHYLDAMLREKIPLLVSLTETREQRENMFNNFWTEHNITKIASAQGWKFTVAATRTLATTDNTPVALYEREIKASKAGNVRTLIHLHLDGWKDGTAAPNESIFLQLMDRIEMHQEALRSKQQNDCVAIHCYSGFNRTGATALQLHLRYIIRDIVTAGCDTATTAIDIAQQIIDFRLNREQFMSHHPAQIAQSYRLAGLYCEKRVQQLRECVKNATQGIQIEAQNVLLEYLGFTIEK